MPFIDVKLWKGRNSGQKRELIKKITDATVEAIGCPAEAVQVAICEYDKEDWGVSGEQSSVKYPDDK